MVHVCAWCQRYLGAKAFEPVIVTHGICDPCVERQQIEKDPPVVVLSPTRSNLLPLFSAMLRGTPEIRVVVDRRCRQRRASSPAALPSERRSGRDRRREVHGFVA